MKIMKMKIWHFSQRGANQLHGEGSITMEGAKCLVKRCHWMICNLAKYFFCSVFFSVVFFGPIFAAGISPRLRCCTQLNDICMHGFILRGTKSAAGEDNKIVFTRDPRHQLRWREAPRPNIFNYHYCLHISILIKCAHDEDAPRDLPGLPHEYCQQLARFQ